MSFIRSKRRASTTKLDTSYTSFQPDQCTRSPRTPTYCPDSPSSISIAPFDHDRYSPPASAYPPPPPEEPAAWIWICHLCHSRYPLGVTRRCLVDGHYYCSGETNRPSLKKRKKKNKSCSSEFDYVTWKKWGDWRRQVLRIIDNERVLTGCERCNFPSQCRYSEDSHPLQDTESTSLVERTLAPDQHDDSVNAATEKATQRVISTSNKSINFDQILMNIYPDAKENAMSDKSLKKMHNGGSSSRHHKDGTPLPTVEEEIAREEDRYRQLRSLDIWSGLEDVELEKAKVE